MVRKKIPIKKIVDVTARQVTFSKRKGGFFKKPRELSVLCDAEIALFMFSPAAKLFEYASSSMQKITERYILCSELNLDKLDQSYPTEQIRSNYSLNKQLEDRSREMRQLNGEELQGLTLKELQKLEERLKSSLDSVHKAKVKKFIAEISMLKQKENKLKEDNRLIKQSIKHVQDTSLTLGIRFPSGSK